MEIILNAGDAFTVPGMQLPSFRKSFAVQNKTDKNILMVAWGGIGDQICAEPTMRFALEYMFTNGEKVTLASEFPEIFAHLKFHDVYDLRRERPIEDDYLVFSTNNNHTEMKLDPHRGTCEVDLPTQFLNSNVINCIDYLTMRAFAQQLPTTHKSIKTPGTAPSGDILKLLEGPQHEVFVHPGKHWQSKTFPKKWWDEVLAKIIEAGFKPVLIGKEAGAGQGTVDVDTTGCIDLRNKTTIAETIWLLKKAMVLICNDSSPLHMAAAGDAWIGCIATAKHPNLLTHWRNGHF